MFNRSEIMKAAHCYAQAYQGRDWSYAFLLPQGSRRHGLKPSRGSLPRSAAPTPSGPKSTSLKFKSLRVNLEPRRRQLETQLAAIAG
ncbi:hypothetical protein [Mesorhizobium sp. M1136]|uniref:hypothetical protein n=1 Tax=Mesorhizobium sp. M1136 TaxID=2957059 RepID=UPI00333811F7